MQAESARPMVRASRRWAGKLVRSFLRPFGKTISGITDEIPESEAVLLEVIRRRPDVVLDVGANEGQFASRIRSCGYTGPLVSFEPQPGAFDTLVQRSDADPAWECHQIAVGDTPGKLTMHISASSQSSSLLPIGRLHVEVMPHTAEISNMSVPVVRLDDWARAAGIVGRRSFLKLDVQGFESHALRGARELLQSVDGVLAELNFAPLFDGQSKYYQVMELLESSGLRFVRLVDIHRHPKTREFLWADGFFVRP